MDMVCASKRPLVSSLDVEQGPGEGALVLADQVDDLAGAQSVALASVQVATVAKHL